MPLLYESSSIPYEDSWVLYEDYSATWEIPVTTGKLHIKRFEPSDPLYTIENEVIGYGQISAAQDRVNIVSVDGNIDSWTEYDRDDLTVRDTGVVRYFDLPELRSPGEVRQRALEELKSSRLVNSPGGDLVWDPRYVVKDSAYWIDEDSQKYTVTLEGLKVSFDQGTEPFQRISIDNGNVVVCDDNPDEGNYFARDQFERTPDDDLGEAITGGTWTTV
jgi:hypothetical protein